MSAARPAWLDEQAVYLEARDSVIVLDSEKAVRAFVPDFDLLKQLATFAVIVTAPGDGVEDQMDIPLRVNGILQVGAFRHQGTLSGIYRLSAKSVTYAP